MSVSLVSMLMASTIIGAGVVDDLLSRKFHNWLFIACTVLGVGTATITSGWSGLTDSALGFLAGGLIFLPLVLVKVVGAGDMKLLAAFGSVAGWSSVLSVAILALSWGALFGLIRVIVSGELRKMLANLLTIVSLRKVDTAKLTHMPFTVAILMGWLSHLVIAGVL